MFRILIFSTVFTGKNQFSSWNVVRYCVHIYRVKLIQGQLPFCETHVMLDKDVLSFESDPWQAFLRT